MDRELDKVDISLQLTTLGFSSSPPAPCSWQCCSREPASPKVILLAKSFLRPWYVETPSFQRSTTPELRGCQTSPSVSKVTKSPPGSWPHLVKRGGLEVLALVPVHEKARNTPLSLRSYCPMRLAEVPPLPTSPKVPKSRPPLHRWGIQPTRFYAFEYITETFHSGVSSGKLHVLKPAWQLS